MEFPESSRFIKIHHGSATNHHGTPRYTTILQIVANRSSTVDKNRECVNRPVIFPCWVEVHFNGDFITSIVIYDADSDFSGVNKCYRIS